MREVVILGVGLHPFGRFADKSLEDLGKVAIEGALQESGVPFKDVEAAYVGHLYAPIGTGRRVVSQFGHTGIPIYNVEVACTSSTIALFQGARDVACGIHDVVLAVGVEKLSKGVLAGLTESGSFEEKMGLLVMPAVYGSFINKHMHDYGTTREQIAMCSVKEHYNGTLNPNAHFQKPCTVEEVLSSRLISDPVTLLMCSASSEGASAAIICAKEIAGKYQSKPPIKMAAWSFSSGTYTQELSEQGGTHDLAKKVYAMAGIQPRDVDVVQLHDAFSPAEILVPEHIGLIPEGQGGRWVEEGKTAINGILPINTDGGLISRGHPTGATGLAQVAELVYQLRGEAGKRQIAKPPRIAVQHNQGLGGEVIAVYTKS